MECINTKYIRHAHMQCHVQICICMTNGNKHVNGSNTTRFETWFFRYRIIIRRRSCVLITYEMTYPNGIRVITCNIYGSNAYLSVYSTTENEFRLVFGPEIPQNLSRFDKLLPLKSRVKKPNQIILRTPNQQLKSLWKLLLQRQM